MEKILNIVLQKNNPDDKTDYLVVHLYTYGPIGHCPNYEYQTYKVLVDVKI